MIRQAALVLIGVFLCSVASIQKGHASGLLTDASKDHAAVFYPVRIDNHPAEKLVRKHAQISAGDHEAAPVSDERYVDEAVFSGDELDATNFVSPSSVRKALFLVGSPEDAPNYLTRASAPIYEGKSDYGLSLIWRLINPCEAGLAHYQFRGMRGIKLIAGKFDLVSCKDALNEGGGSKRPSEQSEPQRIVGYRIGKPALPKSFVRFAIWLGLMLGLCCVEAILVVRFWNGDRN